MGWTAWIADNVPEFNARTLSCEASLAVLFEELTAIKWNVIGLIKDRRRDDAYTVLNSGHVLCYCGLANRRELGSLFNKDIVGNIEEFCSINERVADLIIKLDKKYKLKMVQAYAPIFSRDDHLVERFYEDGIGN